MELMLIIYVVKFHKNFWPREIGFQSFLQARKVCEFYNIEENKIKCLYMEEDELRIPYQKDTRIQST